MLSAPARDAQTTSDMSYLFLSLARRHYIMHGPEAPPLRLEKVVFIIVCK